MMKIALITLSSTYLVGIVALYLAQEWLIFPGKDSQGQPFSVVHPPKGTELVYLTTSQNEKVAAIFGPALTADGKPFPNASRRPTLIYFYGNAMCLNDALMEFQEYRSLGVNVLIPDYVGYGMSTGKVSEAACYRTADAAFNHLLSRQDVDPGKIVVLGRSLGTGVAVDLASRKPVAGLVIFSAYTSMGAMAWQQFPFVPVSLVLKHRFDNLSKITQVNCPILIGHGKSDTIIPCTMSQRLTKAAKTPVTTFYPEHMGHNDFFGDQTLVPLREFLDKLA